MNSYTKLNACFLGVASVLAVSVSAHADDDHRGGFGVLRDGLLRAMSEPGYPFNNSIWMCLEDGKDGDTLSDGCVRVVAVNDLEAETTGGFFDNSGRHYYFSVQHNVTGHGVILDVTGWKRERDRD